jgi:hypothetical protein
METAGAAPELGGTMTSDSPKPMQHNIRESLRDCESISPAPHRTPHGLADTITRMSPVPSPRCPRVHQLGSGPGNVSPAASHSATGSSAKQKWQQKLSPSLADNLDGGQYPAMPYTPPPSRQDRSSPAQASQFGLARVQASPIQDLPFFCPDVCRPQPLSPIGRVITGETVPRDSPFPVAADARAAGVTHGERRSPNVRRPLPTSRVNRPLFHEDLAPREDSPHADPGAAADNGVTGANRKGETRRTEMGAVAVDVVDVVGQVTVEWLPNELLIDIFRCLDPVTVVITLRCVCRRWNDLVNDPRSDVPGHQLDLTQLYRSPGDPPGAQLPFRYRRTGGLTLGSHGVPLSTWFVRLIQLCPRLTTINFGDFKQLTNGCLLAIAESCPALAVLSVRSCCELTDVGMVPLAERCAQLSVIDVTSCSGLSAASGQALITNCQELTSFNASYCRVAVGQPMQPMVWPVGHCPQLQRVDVSFTNVDDVDISALARSCPGLIAINLTYCTRITSNSAIALGANCRWLSVARFDWCKRLSDHGITALAKGCPQLTKVSVQWCTALTSSSIVALANNCPQCTEVNHHGTDADLRRASSAWLRSRGSELRLNFESGM